MQHKQTYAWLGYAILFVLGLVFVLGEGESCDDGQGICKPISLCEVVAKTWREIPFTRRKYCNVTTGLVCCPLPAIPANCNINMERKFEKACRRYIRIAPGTRMVPYIIHGSKAKPKELPFMAVIGTQQPNGPINWNCAGSLISENFVLTASHCLVNRQKDIDVQVRLGELDYNSTEDDAQPQHFTQKNIYHFGTDDEVDDIALIELNQAAILNEYVLPACLPDPSCSKFANYAVAGWGQVDPMDASKKSSHLLKTLLKPYPNCDIPSTGTRPHVCAGSPKSKRDTCHGDSGGPLFWNHPNYESAKLIIGISSASMGHLCGEQDVPTVYTNVSSYIDWIEALVWPK